MTGVDPARSGLMAISETARKNHGELFNVVNY